MFPAEAETAVWVNGISHAYGRQVALRKVSFAVPRGSVFGLLGPNGSGKSTLFRILATLLRPSEGEAFLLGRSLLQEPAQVRERIGVVFQGSILDPKLSLLENLQHVGHLRGLRGRSLRERIEGLLEEFDLSLRGQDRVETLSGGLRRRGELAAALLHRPALLLLDEPTAGLDPNARRQFWTLLEGLHRRQELTVLVSTHLMDEAERCDRLVLLHRGEIVAEAEPEALRAGMGYEVITIRAEHPGCPGRANPETVPPLAPLSDGRTVRIETEQGARWIGPLMEAFSEEIRAITLGRPSLDDVFFFHTGQALESGEDEAS
ncbi:MAG: ABC transporter [Candidatus Poribacteria bacterium]|nr:MAG: ABC transporter [Candidatus Poribacteria bacterium]